MYSSWSGLLIHQTHPIGDCNRGSRALRVSNGKKCKKPESDATKAEFFLLEPTDLFEVFVTVVVVSTETPTWFIFINSLLVASCHLEWLVYVQVWLHK